MQAFSAICTEVNTTRQAGAVLPKTQGERQHSKCKAPFRMLDYGAKKCLANSSGGRRGSVEVLPATDQTRAVSDLGVVSCAGGGHLPEPCSVVQGRRIRIRTAGPELRAPRDVRQGNRVLAGKRLCLVLLCTFVCRQTCISYFFVLQTSLL